jgi:hypothetical protein
MIFNTALSSDKFIVVTIFLYIENTGGVSILFIQIRIKNKIFDKFVNFIKFIFRKILEERDYLRSRLNFFSYFP